MEIQIISKKMITPSSPSSSHDIKISCIDQLAYPGYIHIIFYYDGDNTDTAQKLTQLERSLSDTLSIFYPLAGRYDKNNMSVACNDKGVEFVETRVNCKLNRLIAHPDLEELRDLATRGSKYSATAPLVTVQVNVFVCGGLAIGFQVSHIVSDMYTFSLFCNAWANVSMSKTDQTLIRPNFDLASVFPPREVPDFWLRLGPPYHEKVVTKTFVFCDEAISRLKAKARARDSMSWPSRVQAVTALLWKTFTRVSKAKRGRARASMMIHAFNLREKTNLPLPKNSCGNLWRLVLAKLEPNEDELETDLEDIMGIVIDSMTTATLECSKPFVTSDDVFVKAKNAMEETLRLKDRRNIDDSEVFDFTSWCKMGHYDVDFGWGRPSWVSSTCMPCDGYVVLMDTKEGDGIEVWVSLEEEKMIILEQDRDIMSYLVT